jgi:hypothetical protein
MFDLDAEIAEVRASKFAGQMDSCPVRLARPLDFQHLYSP